MVEKRYIAKKGFERFFDTIIVEKENFENDLALAKEKAIAEVENAFADKKAIIDEIFNKVSEIVEVEVADEIPQETSQTIFDSEEENQTESY